MERQNMNDILKLIPQRSPIVMVDAFLGIEDEISRTTLTVREGNLFVSDGVLSECGLIEHMAQSAAAREGFVCSRENRAVPIGYIASVNDFSCEALPAVGSVLQTEVRVVQQIGALSLIEAESVVDGRKIAVGKMKIVLEQ